MDTGGKDRPNENRASFAALPHAGTALLFIALTAGDARLPVHTGGVGVSAALQATRAIFALAIAVALICGFPRMQRLGQLVLVSALTCMAILEVGFQALSRSMAPRDATVALLVGTGLLAAGVVWHRHTWSQPRTPLMAGAIGALGALGTALVVLLGPGIRQESLAAVDVMSSLALLLLLQVGITYMRQAWRLQIDAVRSHERELIARDLHDGLGQDLATIVLHAEGLPSQAGAEHPMTVAARNALAIVRGAMLDLSASAESSLDAALNRMAEELGARYGTQVAVRVSIDTDVAAGLETGARDEIVRIAREAIVNAATHGRANMCWWPWRWSTTPRGFVSATTAKAICAATAVHDPAWA